MKHRIFLLRHGESTGNRDAVRQGQLDYPLAPEGEAQIRELSAAWLEKGVPLNEIITSPLTRAHRSAEILAQVLSVPLTVEPLWAERDAGQAQGKPIQGSDAPPSGDTRPHAFQPHYEGGESLIALHQRATSALAAVLSKPPGTYLVVAHGGILAAAVRAALGLQPSAWAVPAGIRFDNAAFAELVLDDQRRTWSVLHVNAVTPPTLPDAES
jgi:2,3-bisphosphoglycerate-dependent phosphoglycerate mutase